MASSRTVTARSVGFDSSRKRPKGDRSAWLFIAPWLIGFIFLIVVPSIGSFVLSLFSWDLLSDPAWLGLGNYSELWGDPNFWKSLTVTATYLVVTVPLLMAAGLGISLLLNLKLPGIRLFRTVLYLPAVLSGVAISVLWLSLLNPDFGAVNTVLRSIGISNPPGWLDDPSWALWAAVLVALWGVGANAIIYLAGLQNVPAQLYEAAMIDGAGAVRRFWSVTLPMLTPTLFFTLITSLVAAFQVFDVAFILGGSKGGREQSLLFYLLNLWREGFVKERFGYASALSWVLIALSMVVIVVTMRTQRLWVFDEFESDQKSKAS
jgi:multiple sugar transport system permease protein